MAETIDEYKKHVSERLSVLRELFARSAIGDFSTKVNIPPEEDEFTELFVGMDLLLGVVREKISELEEAYARDEAILKNIGEGLVVTDNTRRVTFVNNSAKSLLGYTEKQLIGQIWGQTIPQIQDEAGKILSSETESTHGEASYGLNYCYYVKSDSNRFPVNSTRSDIQVDDRKLGEIIIFRDMSKELEIDRAKTEFVSLVSHQLRTPLSTIKWYAEIMANKQFGELTEKQAKYLNQITISNKRMLELINSLLNLSRIELGTLTATFEETEMDKVIDSLLEELSIKIHTKHLQIYKIKSDVSGKIKTDAKLIRIALHNLLTNAINYTPENGSITVQIEVKNGNMLISIKDTGHGIPENEKSEIFKKFFRASNVRSIVQDGTGLGLYLTKRIIEKLLHGKIWFNSAEDQGTTFYVELPNTTI